MWKVLLFVKTLVYVLIFPRFLNSDSRFERKWDYKVGIKLSKEKSNTQKTIKSRETGTCSYKYDCKLGKSLWRTVWPLGIKIIFVGGFLTRQCHIWDFMLSFSFSFCWLHSGHVERPGPGDRTSTAAVTQATAVITQILNQLYGLNFFTCLTC